MKSTWRSKLGLREIQRLLELDRAVIYAITLRLWQLASGPVSILLITKFLTKDLQGYYYTFGSILTLQMLFELGLSTVLVNLVAHEWAHLGLSSDGSTVRGNPEAGARLASLIRFSDRWYSLCAGVFVVGVGASGAFFFRGRSDDIAWQWPWWALVITTGLSLKLIPRIAVLEGCHRMAEVNAVRCWQAVSGNLAVWTALALQGGLWTVVVSGIVRLGWELWLVKVRFRDFLEQVQQLNGPEVITWKDEIWPLQWRIAIQGLGLWAATNLFNPVMFHYHGPAIAGQMGMTWSLITAVQAMGGAWIATRVPLISELVARRQFRELNRLLLKLTAISVGFLITGTLAVLGGLFILNQFFPRLANRLLPIYPTAVFFAAIIVNQLLLTQAYNIRAHRRDPLWLMATTVYLLLGFLVWYTGSSYGATGAAWAYFSIITFIYAPLHTLIWLRTKEFERTIDQAPDSANAD